jgi:hypothetical protein
MLLPKGKKMTEKTPLKQPAKTPDEKKKPAALLLPGLIVILAAALIYALVTFTGIFDIGKKTTGSLLSSYQLYSPKDVKIKALLFFGNPQAEGFKTSPAEIYSSALQINRIKQLIMLLTQGPKDKTVLNLLPEGTALKDAYLDANSILYLDMSPEFAANCRGGTTGEYEAVYSILDTVFYNFPWVKGVKFAVNGAEKDSLAGHIIIKSILTPDTDLTKLK